MQVRVVGSGSSAPPYASSVRAWQALGDAGRGWEALWDGRGLGGSVGWARGRGARGVGAGSVGLGGRRGVRDVTSVLPQVQSVAGQDDGFSQFGYEGRVVPSAGEIM